MTEPTIETNIPAPAAKFTREGKEIVGIPQRTETGAALLKAIWEDIKLDHSAWNQGVWIGREVGSYDSYSWARSVDPAVLDYIAENEAVPWDCGTACCLAGHAALSKGYKITSSGVRDLVTSGFAVNYVTGPTGTGDAVGVDDAARTLLGLDGRQALTLFDHQRRPYEIELMTEALLADPDANLFDVIVDFDTSVAREWEKANGFRDENGEPVYTTDSDDGYNFYVADPDEPYEDDEDDEDDYICENPGCCGNPEDEDEDQ